ncbi:MAG: branched-chain amino acid ABC transporter permease, partial [Phototrophicales bacterium]
VNGIAIGCIIALAAIGLTLTYSILKLSNFAHGDYMTLGAYLTWIVNTAIKLNIWLSMIVGAVGTVLAMLLAEFLLWKPMRDRRASSTTLIIISIGLALFIRSTILLIWGGSTQSYDLPVVAALDIVGVRIAFNRIIAIGIT